MIVGEIVLIVGICLSVSSMWGVVSVNNRHNIRDWLVRRRMYADYYTSRNNAKACEKIAKRINNKRYDAAACLSLSGIEYYVPAVGCSVEFSRGVVVHSMGDGETVTGFAVYTHTLKLREEFHEWLG